MANYRHGYRAVCLVKGCTWTSKWGWSQFITGLVGAKHARIEHPEAEGFVVAIERNLEAEGPDTAAARGGQAVIQIPYTAEFQGIPSQFYGERSGYRGGFGSSHGGTLPGTKGVERSF